MFKKVSIFIILITLCYGDSAQVVFNSLEDAWTYADIHNVSIRTARFEIDKSVYAKKTQYSAMLPQVTATGNYTDNIQLQTTLIPGSFFGGPPGSYRTLQFGTQFVYTGGVSAQMNILNLQNWFNVKIAKQTEEINRDSLANTRKNVYQQVATQFYSYLLMEEAARLAIQTALVADSVYQSAGNKFKQGAVDQGNVDLAKLNLERAQQSQISAEYQAVIARNNLKALLGLSVKDSLRIDATMQASLRSGPASVFGEDPAIRLALLKTEINLSSYKLTNSQFAPTLNILYNYTNQRYDNKYQPFSDYTGVTAWFPAQYWSLQLNVPIFTGGSRLFQSRRSKIIYDESVMQYEIAQKQSAINDENIRLNYQKAVAVLGKAEDVMDLSFDNFTHISNRYEEGVEPLDTRLNAFRDYIDYQNQYLNSLSDLLVQLYQVKIRQQSFD
jgi:outer membrane protein